MKKEDVPQDLGALGKITTEVCYATDESGKYITQRSNGWDVKTTALDAAWKDIDDRVKAAREKILSKQASPVLFFMERGLMDVSILAAYTGFFTWQVKRHLKPDVFEKLPDKKLQKYAEVFNVSVEDFKTMNVHEH